MEITTYELAKLLNRAAENGANAVLEKSGINQRS